MTKEPKLPRCPVARRFAIFVLVLSAALRDFVFQIPYPHNLESHLSRWTHVSLDAFDSGYQLCYSRAGCRFHSFATGHTLRCAVIGPSISGTVESQIRLPV